MPKSNQHTRRRISVASPGGRHMLMGDLCGQMGDALDQADAWGGGWGSESKM